MIAQKFSIGDDDWFFEVYYDIGAKDLDAIHEIIVDSVNDRQSAEDACHVLSNCNSGYIYTNFSKHLSLIFVSQTTSAEQMYDSIQHETRHAADHIGGYYGLNLSGEEIAYLQGEIARKMFPAAAMVVCPKCNCYRRNISGMQWE